MSTLTQVVVEKKTDREFAMYFDAGSGWEENRSRIRIYFDAGSGWEENRSRICMYFDAGSAGDQNKSRKHRMNFSGS